jgi:hypothetical protein
MTMDIHGHTMDRVGLWVKPEKPNDEIHSQPVPIFIIASREIINIIIASRAILNVIIASRAIINVII